MIVKTEAIVLRSRKFRETSKILNLYTREFGKISVIAKGARGPRSKFGAALQPLGHVVAVLYKNDQRELHLLSQCDILTEFRKLPEDLETFTAAMSVVEFVECVAHDEERNDQLFDLTLSTLTAMNNAGKSANNLQFYFEVHLSDILGFKPNFHSCILCGRVLDETYFGTKEKELRLGNAGVLCADCTDRCAEYGNITPGSLKVLQRLQHASEPGSATQMNLSEHQTQQLRTALRHYLQNHVGGLHRLKAHNVAASIM